MLPVPRFTNPSTLLIVGCTLLVTWGVRWWVEYVLPYGQPVLVVGEIFRLTYRQNSGVAFSVLRDSALVPWLSAFGLVAVVIYLAPLLGSSRLGRVAVGLICGGGLSNLIDRLDNGSVTDYLDFGVGTWRYATFNLPDALIFVGVALTGLMFSRADIR